MPALSLPARLYAQIMSWREAAYTKGWLSRWRPPAPCISVGNIRWGGTGKTPLCQWLLHWTESKSLRPSLLTRGYKAAPPALPYHVRPDSPVAHAGDEPLLLARTAPSARIIVDPRRIRSGPWAWKRWKPDLFILDDGFQHLKVVRDLDLVLLLPKDLDADWDRMTPAGPWREGPAALARADALLIKADARECTRLQSLIQDRLARLDKPMFSFSFKPCALTELRSKIQTQNLGRPYLLVSGVAQPAEVEQTAKRLLMNAPAKRLDFADHHCFTRRDILRVLQEAQSLHLHDVVCTAKDAVKLIHLLEPKTTLQWWRLDMEVVFGPPLADHPAFPEWLETWWSRCGAT